mgnify:CR=1 FL=1
MPKTTLSHSSMWPFWREWATLRQSLIVAVLIGAVYLFAREYYELSLEQQLINSHELGLQQIERRFRSRTSALAHDTLQLAQVQHFSFNYKPTIPQHITMLTSLYSHVAAKSPECLHVSLLDENATELIRVNRVEQALFTIPPHQLQVKPEYKLQEALYAQESGSVTLGEIRPNLEHGYVQAPIQPLLQFVTPVSRTAGKLAFVVINYRIDQILESEFGLSNNQIGLLNANGDWLLHWDSNTAWTTLLSHRDNAFGRVHATLWQQIKQTPYGRWQDDDRRYLFRKVTLRSPINQTDAVSDTGLPAWINTAQLGELYLVERIDVSELKQLSVFRRGVSAYILAGSAILSVILMHALIAHRRHRQWLLSQFQAQAFVDPLTGAANRRYFYEVAQRELASTLRHKKSLCLLLLDIDYFKHINDSYGHAAGDDVLKHVVNTCKKLTRADDFICRHGGEEFVILLPQTPLEEARAKAENIRAALENLPIVYESRVTLRITVSIGIAEFGQFGNHDIDTLLKSADRQLYVAKTTGRNKTSG